MSYIATLHGLEEHDGRQFIVMELVEGETLAERIERGPIPFDEALPLFVRVPQGSDAAHEKSITHRDLKPANIKIGPDTPFRARALLYRCLEKRPNKTLSAAPKPRGASWGSRDTIVFAPIPTAGLTDIAAHGGEPELLTTLEGGGALLSHRWPEFLPDGNAIVYTRFASDRAQIVVDSFDGGEPRILVERGTHARYVPTEPLGCN